MTEQHTIVVDDHKLFRKGLTLILNDIDYIKVIAEANNGREFLEMIEHSKPDLVLMDIKMPEVDGVEATQRAIKKYPDLKIIALSMFGDVEYYNKMLEAGVKGFLLKNSDTDELRKALKTVVEGNSYFSQELLLNLVKTYREGENSQPKAKLTDREIEVLRYICQGFSNHEIAKKMFLSQRTVESHRANLLSKTNAKNSINLVVYAIKNDLYQI